MPPRRTGTSLFNTMQVSINLNPPSPPSPSPVPGFPVNAGRVSRGMAGEYLFRGDGRKWHRGCVGRRHSASSLRQSWRHRAVSGAVPNIPTPNPLIVPPSYTSVQRNGTPLFQEIQRMV